MSMKPGSSVRSSSSRTSASAGIVSDERAPAAVIRRFSMTTAARSTGSRPVAVDESLGDDDECWQLTYLRDRELNRTEASRASGGSAASRSKSSRVSMSIG